MKEFEKEKKLLEICIKNKITVGAAESVTGGMLSSRIVSIPNASQYFLGSIIAYSNEVKKKILNVSEKTLEHFGAVSAETALEMLKGVQTIIHPKLAVAITGIAGPSGGTTDKPVGFVVVAFGFEDNIKVETLQLTGCRTDIIVSAVEATLDLMLNYIKTQM